MKKTRLQAEAQTLKRSRIIYCIIVLLICFTSCKRVIHSEIKIKNFTFSGLDYILDTLVKNDCVTRSIYLNGDPYGSLFEKNCHRFINDSIALNHNNDSITFGEKLYSRNISNSNYILKVFKMYHYPFYHYSFHFIDTTHKNNICSYESYLLEKNLEGYTSKSMTIQLDVLSQFSDKHLNHLIDIFSNPIKIDKAESCCCEPSKEIEKLIEENRPVEKHKDSVLYIN